MGTPTPGIGQTIAQTRALADTEDPTRGYWLLVNVNGQLQSLLKRIESGKETDIYKIRTELKSVRTQVKQMIEWTDSIIGYSDD